MRDKEVEVNGDATVNEVKEVNEVKNNRWISSGLTMTSFDSAAILAHACDQIDNICRINKAFVACRRLQARVRS